MTDVSYLLTLSRVIRTFKSKALSELWTEGRSSKIDAKMHKRIFARLDRLDVAVRAEEMNIPGFDFHALHGFNPKRYSVHVNGPVSYTHLTLPTILRV